MRRAACRRGLLVPHRTHQRACWPAGARAPALGGPRGSHGLRQGRHKPSAFGAALAVRWREARADALLPRAEACGRARRRSDSLRNAAASTQRSGPEGAPERRCGTPPRAHTRSNSAQCMLHGAQTLARPRRAQRAHAPPLQPHRHHRRRSGSPPRARASAACAAAATSAATSSWLRPASTVVHQLSRSASNCFATCARRRQNGPQTGRMRTRSATRGMPCATSRTARWKSRRS